jgi:hypothetical protein
MAFLAEIAGLAGNPRIHRHALPAPLAAGDHAGALVPQDQGLRDPALADATFQKPVNVGAADAHGGHAHQRLAGAGHRRRLLVLAQVPRAV